MIETFKLYHSATFITDHWTKAPVLLDDYILSLTLYMSRTLQYKDHDINMRISLNQEWY